MLRICLMDVGLGSSHPALVAESGPPPGKGFNPVFPATTTYLISPSGSWQQLSARGYTTLDGKVLPPQRGQAGLWWTAVAAAGATALMYYVLQHRVKSGTGRRPSQSN